MPTAKENKSFSFPGYSFNAQAAAISFDSIAAYEIALPALIAAQTGTLTTRTSDTVGTATLGSGHGILTGEIVDIYWSGGVRYGVTVGTVAGTSVPFSLGGGDVLPIATTAITVVLQTEINPLNLDGDNAEIVGVFYRNASDTGANAHIDFQDVGSATIEELDVVHETAAGGLNHITNISGGDVNVYTGNPITKGFASHDSLFAGVLYILAGIDSTP